MEQKQIKDEYVAICQERNAYYRNEKYVKECKRNELVRKLIKVIGAIAIGIAFAFLCLLMFSLVAKRNVKCIYKGNNTYETPEGNLWEYDDGVVREIGNEYSITIHDNGTDWVEDDIVLSVK